MNNLTLEVCIKEYLEESSFGELLQLVTDIYRESDIIKATQKNEKEDQDLRYKVISLLEEIKTVNPDQRIYVETPSGLGSCKLGDALIFVSMDGQIAIDSE